MKFEKLNITKIILLIISLILLGVLIFAAGLYIFGWQDNTTKQVVQIIPYPIAMVGGNMVSYADYFEYQDAVKVNLSEDLTEDILDRMIRDAQVQNLADDYLVKTTDKELEEYYQYLLSRIKISESNAEQTLREEFGISVDTFKKLIVKPDLQESKLRIEILSRDQNSEAYNKAKRVVNSLRDGMNFDEAAAAYSEDQESRYIGGELGIFAVSEIAPWFREAVSDKNEGEISNIVISPTGYHILMLGFRDEDNGTEHVQLKHIFVENEMSQKYIEKELEDTSVIVFR